MAPRPDTHLQPPAGTPLPPSHGEHLIVRYPEDHILHLQLNRPKQLNSMTDVSLALCCATDVHL